MSDQIADYVVMETCWRNRLNLAEMAERCECEHDVSAYESRSGPRCRCCFGLLLNDGPGGGSDV